MAKDLKQLTKNIYDFAKRSEVSLHVSNSSDEALPELIIENFDDEQVWQQLELQNSAHVKDLLGNVAKICTRQNNLNLNVKTDGSSSLTFGQKETSKETKHENKGFQKTASDSGPLSSDVEREPLLTEERMKQSNDGIESGSDSEIDFDFNIGSDNCEESDGEEQSEEEDQLPLDSKYGSPKKKASRSNQSSGREPSVVDDAFFSLADMEEFLEEEDRKEIGKVQKNKGLPNDEYNMDIDYFHDIYSSEDEEVSISKIFACTLKYSCMQETCTSYLL